MRASDHYNGSDVAFQGDRTLLFRKLPANARIQRATAVVTPIDVTKGTNPFAERISFSGSSGDWGATKMVVAGKWVEVDFHARRTLAGVRGLNLANTTLQVDLGGLFVELNPSGGIKTPSDPKPLALGATLANGAFEPLPGLTVTKFKLTNPQAAISDVTEVTIRSVPTNVSLRLGQMPAFWTRVGELTQAETTPDFTTVLQAFLLDAKVEYGFYVVPLVLHSDTIGRFNISLEIEFLVEQALLGEGVNEIVLPFDYSMVPNLPPKTQAKLHVAVPSSARIAPRGISGRVRGSFEETRVVFGEVGPVTSSKNVAISPSLAQAQPVMVPETLRATAVDLLVTNPRAVRLQLDLREDLDGKPGSASLLPKPVQVEVAGPAGSEAAPTNGGQAKWISVPLASEVELVGVAVKKEKRYWLVLQSQEGEAAWSTVSAGAGDVALQSTGDGGFSWRDAVGSNAAGKLMALFRLRRRPEQFQVPIELRVGEGADAVTVKLDRFQHLGRVDFNLDFDEVSQAFNKVAKAAGASCPEGEQIANGDFDQWFSLGDTLRQTNGIPLAEAATVFATAPDGTWAYVGASTKGKSGLLRVVDLTCNRETDIEIPLEGIPTLLTIAPDGVLAYVTYVKNETRLLQLIDTKKHRVLGDSIPFGDDDEVEVTTLTVSPDAKWLYMAFDVVLRAPTGIQALVLAVKSSWLEHRALQGLSSPTSADFMTTDPADPISASITRLAVSPDGSRLYATTSNPSKQGQVRIFDAASLKKTGNAIDVGSDPQGISISPDGTFAAVAHSGTNLLSLIDTETREVRAIGNGSNAEPIGVALSPDGTRAYVIDNGVQKLRAIDLKTGEEKTEGISPSHLVELTAFGLSPRGDLIWIAATTDETSFGLCVVEMGERLPLEWNRTSGYVRLVSLSEPVCTVALLGNRGEEVTPRPNVISQVVAVTASCPYELSFLGLASGEDAVVEVLWLNQDCGLLRTDRVPLREDHSDAILDMFAELSSLTPGDAGYRQLKLQLHRRRLSPPEGAQQAEIRVSVPDNILALIDQVSFQASDNAVENSDLATMSDDHLDGWTLSPGTAPGVALLKGMDAFLLRNTGPEEVALVQESSAHDGQTFALEFEGRALVSTPASNNPRVELLWLKADGTPAGSPVRLELMQDSFESLAANGDTPAGSAKVEIHLVVPPGTAQAIKRVSLKFSKPVIVPVNVIAQAPGEATITDWRVAFEHSKPQPAPIRKEGLCAATPPSGTPGETDCHGCHCHRCDEHKTMAEPQAMVTRNGRPVSVARCQDCGAEMVSFGGKLVPGAPLFSLERTALPPPVIIVPDTLLETSARMETRRDATAQPVLTDINGIGEARAKQLKAIGIKTVEALAVARNEDLVRGASPMTSELAARLIERAKQLLASSQRPLSKKMWLL